MWKGKAERPSRKKKKKKKKKCLFSCFLCIVLFFLFFFSTYSSSFHPPTLSQLPPAAARSRCHHLFLYFPHLSSRNRSWLSFLADSVISARPQLGRAPGPTGDPGSCRSSRKEPAQRRPFAGGAVWPRSILLYN